MTPEERARIIWVQHEGATFDDIASAIRAAENEALERAAATLDKATATCGGHGCVPCDQRKRDARSIRAHKHPEGER